jgi:L-ascorbate metabolism protein UlaG (beta-lactamase superfamily)
VKIKFLGHSSFKVTSNTGTTIITDPYHTAKEFLLSEINESADIVTVSHEHPDHNNIEAIQGNPQVVKGSVKIKGIEFKTVLSYHDNVEGKERGNNLIFTFKIDGINVCHLGDLGHPLNGQQLTEIGQVDVLLVPVGGGFTIGATDATDICAQIKPKVIIPMHYKTAGLQFLEDVGDFLRGKKDIIQSVKNEVEFEQGTLPTVPQIIVLKPSQLMC